MTNLDRATTIRRTVANKAYQLLKDCKEPELAFDGYDEYLKEHWNIEFNELHYEVVIGLQNQWTFEEGDELDKQILFHCEQFMDSDEYDNLKQRVRREFYEYEEQKHEQQKYERAHQPTWRP